MLKALMPIIGMISLVAMHSYASQAPDAPLPNAKAVYQTHIILLDPTSQNRVAHMLYFELISRDTFTAQVAVGPELVPVASEVSLAADGLAYEASVHMLNITNPINAIIARWYNQNHESPRRFLVNLYTLVYRNLNDRTMTIGITEGEERELTLPSPTVLHDPLVQLHNNAPQQRQLRWNKHGIYTQRFLNILTHQTNIPQNGSFWDSIFSILPGSSCILM